MRNFACLAPILVTTWLFIVSPNLQAQPRVFVSGSGNDQNACSVTAPCRTFQKAHNVVAENGEIVVLGSAGYGPVSITKSVSITAPDGIYAGITVATGNGISIHGEGISVYLRGLTVVGNMEIESNGVFMDQGFGLTIDRCRISRFYRGLLTYPDTPSQIVTVQDCVLDGNYFGLMLRQSFTATVARCTITGGMRGLLVGAGANVTVEDTIVRGADWEGIWGSGVSNILVDGCTFSGNEVGVGAVDFLVIKLVRTKVTGNNRGLVAVEDGIILSGGQNMVMGNNSDETFSGTFALQ